MRHPLHRLLLALLLFPAAGLHAQTQFTYLNWDELPIDSILPSYTETVPLESDYRSYDYHVSIQYPEWAPLSVAEALAVQRSGVLLVDTLEVLSCVALSRGEASLDYSFVPMVCRSGQLFKLLSAKIDIVPTLKASRLRRAPSRAVADTRYASHSVLATGVWRKIQLTTDGMYYLSKRALRAMGFANPENIRVYGYGGHLQRELIDADADWDDLEPVALIPAADGYLFHAYGLSYWQGNSPVVNFYANAASYFITEDASAVEEAECMVPDIPVGAKDTIVSVVDAHVAYNPEEYAWYQGGRQLYEAYNFASNPTKTYTLQLPTHVAPERASLTVSFSASNYSATTVSTSYSGNALTPALSVSMVGDNQLATQNAATYIVGAPERSTEITISTAPRGNYARLNYLALTYRAALKLDADVPYIQFDYQAGLPEAGEVVQTYLNIEYAQGQQPMLMRLSSPGQPAVEIKGQCVDSTDTDGKTCHFYRVPIPVADYAQHGYIVFDASVAASYPAPAAAGAIDNQDLHATEPAEMVIITPASGIFDSEAERLAQAHRELDDMSVVVVRADRIYNEYSSGTADATAYRRFIKMLYDRADGGANAPRYLLLFGDGAWDNRMLTSAWRGYKPDNFLLCYESVNSYSETSCYVMEDYFGLLDDGEGASLDSEKTDLGVGRFPVRTVDEARVMVDKTIAFMRGENAGAWKNVLAFMGDDGDANQHLKYCNYVAQQVEQRNPELEVRKILWDAYKRQSTASGYRYPAVRQTVLNQMDEGALMMNYTGHAATYTISHEQVLRLEDFASVSLPRVGLWVAAACDVQPFDGQADNIGEAAVLNASGGAVAFYSTARTVYAPPNYTINRGFCNFLFATDASGRHNRLGDAVRLSKAFSLDQRDSFRTNKLHFVLLGDPALQFILSDQRAIVIDSINGQALADITEDITLRAGTRARVAGHVESADGAVSTDFNGVLSLRLYDSRSTVTCLNNTGADSTYVYEVYDKLLYDGTDSIRAGQFALTCPLPIDIAYSDAPARMVMYAVGEGRREANGYLNGISMQASDDVNDDVEGPEITAWLDSEDFTDGSAVCETPYFVATLYDPSGINTSTSGLGHDLELIIDNKAATTYVLNDYYVGQFGDYSRGTVAFTIPALEAGEHTLRFLAWDMLGNPSQTTMRFVVDPSIKAGILELAATESPASQSTTFLVRTDRIGSPCQLTLEVFDFTGRAVWQYTSTVSTSTGIIAVPWSLTTNNGSALPTGVYLYRARISTDGSKAESLTRKLIVNRKH